MRGTSTTPSLIRGFFFDLDGTLVDTHKANYLAYRDAVKDTIGVELGDELIARIKKGEPSDSFLAALLPGISKQDIAAINARKRELYPGHLHASTLNEYLSSFLAAMAEDYVTALVTTAKRQNGLAVVKKHGLEDFFDFMIFGEDVKNMKPDPEAYTAALKKAKLRADEVIAFEDSANGMAAAHAAGIRTIHIRSFL